MFRMSFDRSMLENVKEQPTVYVHAYTDSSLHMQLSFMCVLPAFMRTRTYSCIHISVLEFTRMWFPTCVSVPRAYVRRHGFACACRQSRTLF